MPAQPGTLQQPAAAATTSAALPPSLHQQIPPRHAACLSCTDAAWQVHPLHSCVSVGWPTAARHVQQAHRCTCITRTGWQQPCWPGGVLCRHCTVGSEVYCTMLHYATARKAPDGTCMHSLAADHGTATYAAGCSRAASTQVGWACWMQRLKTPTSEYKECWLSCHALPCPHARGQQPQRAMKAGTPGTSSQRSSPPLQTRRTQTQQTPAPWSSLRARGTSRSHAPSPHLSSGSSPSQPPRSRPTTCPPCC